MRWLSFIQKTVTVTAGAAAGGAATAVTANPVLGAAAGAAATKTTEQILGEFLSAQQDALDTLLERTQNMELLLGGIRSDLQAVIDGPWRTALLHINDAAKHPDRARDELQIARNALYKAMGQATGSDTRTLIAQQLAVVYALLGEPADSRDWLSQSFQEADRAGEQAVATVIDSLPKLPVSKAPVKGRTPETVEVPTGTLAVFQGSEARPWFHVAHSDRKLAFRLHAEPLASALAGLAQTRLDFARLQVACGLADPEIRGAPTRWQVAGLVTRGRAPYVWLRLTEGAHAWTVCSWKDGTPLRASVLLSDLAEWSFSVFGAPVTPPGQLFVSGSSPELGSWEVDRALPLTQHQNGRWGVSLSAVEGERSEPIHYRYFMVPTPGAEPECEQREPRSLTFPPYGDMGPVRAKMDSWNA